MPELFTYEPSPVQLKQLKRHATLAGCKKWQEYVAGEVTALMDKLAAGNREKEVYTTAEAARYLCVSKCSLLRYIKAGMLPNTVAINARVFRIKRTDLLELKLKKAA